MLRTLTCALFLNTRSSWRCILTLHGYFVRNTRWKAHGVPKQTCKWQDKNLFQCLWSARQARLQIIDKFVDGVVDVSYNRCISLCSRAQRLGAAEHVQTGAKVWIPRELPQKCIAAPPHVSTCYRELRLARSFCMFWQGAGSLSPSSFTRFRLPEAVTFLHRSVSRHVEKIIAGALFDML